MKKDGINGFTKVCNTGFLKIRCTIASSGERRNIGSNVLSYLSLNPRMMSSGKRRECYKSHAVWEIELRHRLACSAAKNGAAFARFQERDGDAARWKAPFAIARLVSLIENTRNVVRANEPGSFYVTAGWTNDATACESSSLL